MRKCSKTISAAYQEILWLFWPTTLYYLLVLKKKKDVSPENLISSQRETGWLCLQEKVISVAYDIPSRNTIPEYVCGRERERGGGERHTWGGGGGGRGREVNVIANQTDRGTKWEHSLSKGQVKHHQAWSPNGLVTIMCQALHPPRDFSRVKLRAGCTQVLWMRP